MDKIKKGSTSSAKSREKKERTLFSSSHLGEKGVYIKTCGGKGKGKPPADLRLEKGKK